MIQSLGDPATALADAPNAPASNTPTLNRFFMLSFYKNPQIRVPQKRSWGRQSNINPRSRSSKARMCNDTMQPLGVHLAYSFPDVFSYAGTRWGNSHQCWWRRGAARRMTRAAGKAPLPFKMRGGAGTFASSRGTMWECIDHCVGGWFGDLGAYWSLDWILFNVC
jgi:hypothetical protein